jgi:hypothetical protein
MREYANQKPNGEITPPATSITKPDKDKPFFNVPYNSKGIEFVGRVGKTEEMRFGQPAFFMREGNGLKVSC